MYRINLDVLNKIINIEVVGSLSIDELESIKNDVINLVCRFEPKEFAFLILAQRLDPISQDNILAFQKLIETYLIWAKKVSVVNGSRTVTRLQSKRIEAEARNYINSDTPVMRFSKINEALNYLLKI